MERVLLLLGIITGAFTVTIVQHPPSLVLMVGQTAYMSCKMKDPENVQIKYFYWRVTRDQESILLMNSSRVKATLNSLNISSVTPRDSGLYLCQLLNSNLDAYHGGGTNLLVTATPVMTLRVNKKNLLICQAKRFHPQELELSWNIPTEGHKASQNLTENEDGTYTMRSILEVTEEMLGQDVTCHLRHITRNMTLSHVIMVLDLATDHRYILYQQLFPVRVLLVVILILSFVSCTVYHRLQMLMFLCIGLQTGRLYADEEVTTHLYGTVQLPCTLPFVQDGVTVIWEKIEEDGRKLVVHKFSEGRDSLEEQDSQYRGRTQLSKQFSKRRLDLTLRDVTFSDEGTYSCRAAGEKGHGDLKVTLSIDRLNADDPNVSLVHIDGIRRLKCTTIGVFRKPLVKWTNRDHDDLSSYAANNITTLSDGRQMVESILNYDVETSVHYFCHITEGRLRRMARAVISDGQHAYSFDEL